MPGVDWVRTWEKVKRDLAHSIVTYTDGPGGGVAEIIDTREITSITAQWDKRSEQYGADGWRVQVSVIVGDSNFLIPILIARVASDTPNAKEVARSLAISQAEEVANLCGLCGSVPLSETVEPGSTELTPLAQMAREVDEATFSTSSTSRNPS